MSPSRPRGRGFTLVELMVVVAILSITLAIAISGYRSNPTGGAARKVAAMMATAFRTAVQTGTVTGCTESAQLEFGLASDGTSYQVTVYKMETDTSGGTTSCKHATPYISTELLDGDVEIYGLASQANTLPGASVSAISFSSPIDKSYNPDGTADGFTVYLRHKTQDNATRYRVVGMPLSPAPQVFQDW